MWSKSGGEEYCNMSEDGARAIKVLERRVTGGRMVTERCDVSSVLRRNHHHKRLSTGRRSHGAATEHQNSDHAPTKRMYAILPHRA